MTPPRAPTRCTARLVLRAFDDHDRTAFAAINADPQVMAHYPSPLDTVASDAFVDRIGDTWSRRGYGLWALERRDSGELIGYAGLWPVPDTVPIEPRGGPHVEVGWRLAAHVWGHGYATEAAREALRFGFDDLGLAEVVSFTAEGNARSQAVMRRLGMRRDPSGDFEHPGVPPGHRLRRHVLYRLPRQEGVDPGSAAQTTPMSRRPTRS